MLVPDVEIENVRLAVAGEIPLTPRRLVAELVGVPLVEVQDVRRSVQIGIAKVEILLDGQLQLGRAALADVAQPVAVRPAGRVGAEVLGDDERTRDAGRSIGANQRVCARLERRGAGEILLTSNRQTLKIKDFSAKGTST